MLRRPYSIIHNILLNYYCWLLVVNSCMRESLEPSLFMHRLNLTLLVFGFGCELLCL